MGIKIPTSPFPCNSARLYDEEPVNRNTITSLIPWRHVITSETFNMYQDNKNLVLRDIHQECIARNDQSMELPAV
jgi:hypothetical protein